MRVALKNRVTGQVKFQKIGWSWTCFFFSGLLGIPFIRGLYAWGAIMTVLWAANWFVSILPSEQQVLALVSLGLLGIGLAIYFGIKANALAGLHYLEDGWEFAEPNSAATMIAKQKWGIIADGSSIYTGTNPAH